MISSVGSSGLTQTQGLSPQRKHGGANGQRPELPDSFKSIIESAVQSNQQAGGSSADLQKTVAAKYEEYKKSDAYTALSADKKAQLDEIVKKGPPKEGERPHGPPPAQAASETTDTSSTTDATDPTTVAKQLMDALSQRGDQTRSRMGLSFASEANSLVTSLDE
jgi:hypothetical protein